jgi:hypothetical protein
MLNKQRRALSDGRNLAFFLLVIGLPLVFLLAAWLSPQ